MNDDLNGMIFTGKLKTTRQYVSVSNNIYFLFNTHGDNDQDYKGFYLKYKCDGNKERVVEIPNLIIIFLLGTETTTIQEATTSMDWPVPSTDNNYTAYVSGLYYNLYHEVATITKFRSAVANMAKKYCQTQNYELKEEIT